MIYYCEICEEELIDIGIFHKECMEEIIEELNK